MCARRDWHVPAFAPCVCGAGRMRMSLIVMPSDPIQAIVAAFDRVNLVALGERHWALEDAQFRLQLIRGPGFAQTVDDIVIEFANPLHQALLS